MKREMKRWLLAAFLLCAAAYLMVTTAGICIYAGKDEARRADAAVILGAGTDGGEVSPVYRERLNHGIWLYENGYVKGIIVTGGVGKGQAEADGAIARQYAIQQGIPPEDVYAEEQSGITEENIAYAKEIMEEHSFETAILVSDPLHMRRAMLMASDYGMEAYSSPTPTSMYRSLRTKIPFLCREEFFYVGYRWRRLFHKGAAG